MGRNLMVLLYKLPRHVHCYRYSVSALFLFQCTCRRKQLHKHTNINTQAILDDLVMGHMDDVIVLICAMAVRS